MLTNPTPKSDVQFGEAPASWNTKYVTPDGFECQLTIRGENGTEVLEKSTAAIAFLLKSGCTPSASFRQPSAPRNRRMLLCRAIARAERPIQPITAMTITITVMSATGARFTSAR